MRCLIVYEDVLYEWVPWSGNICSGNCDVLKGCQRGTDINRLCKLMRDCVGSPSTHRFKVVKADNEWRETH